MPEKHWMDYLTALSTSVAAVAASSAIFVGIWQVKVAEDSSKKQLRAYLSATHEYYDQSQNGSGEAFIDLNVVNVGQTPAYNVKLNTLIRDNEINLAKENPNFDLQEGQLMLGSAQKGEYRLYLGTSPQVLKNTIAKGNSKFIYGAVTYEDIYEISHILRFCFSVKSYNDKNKEAPLIIRCNEWNK